MSFCLIGNKIRQRPTIGCGASYPTLISGSIGTAQDTDNIKTEMTKAKLAQAMGVHIIADNSFYGDINEYHRALTGNIDAYIATVASYEYAIRLNSTVGLTPSKKSRLALKILEEQVMRGIDIITIHASVLKNHILMLEKSKRIIPTTSKGGCIISNFMTESENENPYYEFYDEILKIFKQYNVTISLGSTFRPATICDTFDNLLIEELTVMGELVERANNAQVPIMIEGLGHSTINNIPTHIRIAKTLCHDAPYRMLPMATDIAFGYDHISAAIAAAVGVASGVNIVTCVSRAEHVGLPSLHDIEEAIITCKIAVHCGEISLSEAKQTRDRQMSITRWKYGCKGDLSSTIYPNGAEEALKRYNQMKDQEIRCSMCGEFCGIANGKKLTSLKVKLNKG
jgi:phosphomethylpyrimidine synthase